MNLILLPADKIQQGRITLQGREAQHVQNVLKAKPGETIRMGLLNGPRGVGTVVRLGHDEVDLECHFEAAPPPRPPVDLLLALPRPKVMKRLWAQLAALGVGRIILTNAARVERNYFDTHVLEPEFYTPLLIEGLQQAKDTRLPEVSVHRQFKPLIEDDLSNLSDPTDTPLRLLADPEARTGLASAMRGPRALLAVGPEGGWVPFERELLVKHGFVPFSLGLRTLRSDTACVALLALVHQALSHNNLAPRQTNDPSL